MADCAPMLRSGVATGPVQHPHIPPANCKCLWNFLTKELRDEILRYAYGRQPAGLKIKMKSDFDEYNKYEEVQCRKEGRQFKPIHLDNYINRFLVCKTWASEAAQALFSTTDIYFERSYMTDFLPPTYLGVEWLSSIHMNVHDVARVARKLAVVCPRLRHVHVDTTCLAFALLQSYPQTGKSIYLIRWTAHDVRDMSWFRAIRPLSGLKSASIDFKGINSYSYRSEEEQTNITANTKLVQSMFKQSATRAFEAPPALLPLALSSRVPTPTIKRDDNISEFGIILHKLLQVKEKFQEQADAFSRLFDRL